MAPRVEGVSTSRPVILGNITVTRNLAPPKGGSSKPRVDYSDLEKHAERIRARFDEAIAAFDDQIQLSESILSTDPQLVLVLEALDEREDLTGVAQRLGMEILVEADDGVDPTEEFRLANDKARKPYIDSCLHAVCLNKTALDKFLTEWRAWQKNQKPHIGYTPLHDLFKHLKDVRAWGPQDRLKMIDWEEHFSGLLPDHKHSIEIELWYRRNSQTRQKVQREVTTLVEQAGGHVQASAVVEEIGYHALKCSVPVSILRDLARGNFESVNLVRSANIMYFRVTGQALSLSEPADDSIAVQDYSLPIGEPVVCLLDGIPAANHALLRNRVIVHDPDDLSSAAAVNERKHGTQMASVTIWGDLGAKELPLDRPVLIRPVLVPSSETSNRSEELPEEQLVPDLMRRVFRELFDGANGLEPVGQHVTVINLSIGDPATPFDTVLSSWARAIDWLSYHYGVLVVVSVGNYAHLSLAPQDSQVISKLVGAERRQAIVEAQARNQNARRLFSPSESINALSVGALHADDSDSNPQGYAVDPADGLVSLSPISATGSGYRRSIKPDIVTNGGRVVFREPPLPADRITFTCSAGTGPGIRVAVPSSDRQGFIAGTSPAAALITRQAARIHDLVEEITKGRSITRRQRASAIKALLIHGATFPPDLSVAPFLPETALGNGIFHRDYAQGCGTNEAVMLFIGSIKPGQEQELSFPLPDGLGIREAKRIDASLAWLSPVNWRHRQYRCAALSFATPKGEIPGLGKASVLPIDATKRGATTVQHASWEFGKAFPSGQGSAMSLAVQCRGQAGRLSGESIDFAVALSLWIAPTVNVDIYNHVKAQVPTQVSVRPT
ncbi:MAG: S8 family peptidase [Mycobacteriaceae bacterium]